MGVILESWNMGRWVASKITEGSNTCKHGGMEFI